MTVATRIGRKMKKPTFSPATVLKVFRAECLADTLLPLKTHPTLPRFTVPGKGSLQPEPPPHHYPHLHKIRMATTLQSDPLLHFHPASFPVKPTFPSKIANQRLTWIEWLRWHNSKMQPPLECHPGTIRWRPDIPLISNKL